MRQLLKDISQNNWKEETSGHLIYFFCQTCIFTFAREGTQSALIVNWHVPLNKTKAALESLRLPAANHWVLVFSVKNLFHVFLIVTWKEYKIWNPTELLSKRMLLTVKVPQVFTQANVMSHYSKILKQKFKLKIECPSKQIRVHQNLCINALISIQLCISPLHHFVICSRFCYFFHIWRYIVPHLSDERLNRMEVHWNVRGRMKTKMKLNFQFIR